MSDTKLEVRFWGVRGSLPSPGPDTLAVGGNTSCVEVRAGGARLILDAGSGLRALGDAWLASGDPLEVTIALSHAHWDHVMGLPFFAPIYLPQTRLTVACGPCGRPLRELLHRQMSAPMFPVDLDELPSRLSCRDLSVGERFAVGPMTVTSARLNHPDPVYAYRVDFEGHSVVYATDTEHYACVDPHLARLAKGADLLIYDAQYTPEEYAGKAGPARVGWGHSTYEAGIALARAAGVETLALFHHDPRRTDAQVDALVERARRSFASTVAAREGQRLGFGGAASDAA